MPTTLPPDESKTQHKSTVDYSSTASQEICFEKQRDYPLQLDDCSVHSGDVYLCSQRQGNGCHIGP